MYDLIIGSGNTQLCIPVNEGDERARKWRDTYEERWKNAAYVQLEPKDPTDGLKPVRVVIPPGCQPVYYKQIVRALDARNGNSSPMVELWCIGWEAPGSHRMIVTVSKNGYAVSAEPVKEGEEHGGGR